MLFYNLHLDCILNFIPLIKPEFYEIAIGQTALNSRIIKMSKINFNDLSISELIELQSDIERAIASKREAEKAELREQMQAMAAKAGYTIDELLSGGKSSGKSRPTAKPKYRNPDNAAETWSGRGRQPKWVVAYLEAGNALENALIGDE